MPSDDRPLVPHPPLERYYQGADARRPFVSRLFDSGARHYHWINRVMSLGSGVWYRREALRRAGVGGGMTVLDVCVGTGQVARAALDLVGPEGRVVAVDASLGMLVEAGRHVPVPRIQGMVEALPVAGGFADVLTMGYALRHVADLVGTFREYCRVLRPGGRVLIIEFARPRTRAGYAALKLYLRHVVPGIARLGGRDAAEMMRYFWDTIESCVPPEAIVDALADAGFADPVKAGPTELFAEYTAVKPGP